MSGNRFLNCRATPFPMTPTQLTVFTRVCALDSNISPMKTLTMVQAPSGLEEEMSIDGDGEAKSRRLQCLFAFRPGDVGSDDVLRVDLVGHEHFRALYAAAAPLHDLVGVCPPFCENQICINLRETGRRRPER